MPQSVLEPQNVSVPAVDTALRDEWLSAIARLYADVTTWISELPGWSVNREPDKEISEERLGVYTVPVLRITSEDPDEELMLEPWARLPRGRRGTVKLYAWPGLYNVYLVGDGAGSCWDVLTESGIYLRQEWNKENFLQLAKDLAKA